MRAFIINLDRAQDRWASVKQTFAGTGFDLCRITGVDGNTLTFPIDGYSEALYHRLHGRETNPRHVGCYLSHVKAIKAFLETGDTHALIGEDDLLLGPDFETAVEDALRCSKHWNILRLTGLGRGRPARAITLERGYGLSVNFGRLKGTGAYVLDRTAARAWATRLLPMCLPIDHALDREWVQGLRAVCILPFPASQNETAFRSSIHIDDIPKLPALRRWTTTYPYQASNELSRWLFRAVSYLRIRLASGGRSRRRETPGMNVAPCDEPTRLSAPRPARPARGDDA